MNMFIYLSISLKKVNIKIKLIRSIPPCNPSLQVLVLDHSIWLIPPVLFTFCDIWITISNTLNNNETNCLHVLLYQGSSLKKSDLRLF